MSITTVRTSRVIDAAVEYFRNSEYCVIRMDSIGEAVGGCLHMYNETKTFEANRLLHAAGGLEYIVEREYEVNGSVVFTQSTLSAYKDAKRWMTQFGQTEWRYVALPYGPNDDRELARLPWGLVLKS